MFDVRRLGYVTVAELLPQLSALTRACACQKLNLIFNMYDTDGKSDLVTDFLYVLYVWV